MKIHYIYIYISIVDYSMDTHIDLNIYKRGAFRCISDQKKIDREWFAQLDLILFKPSTLIQVQLVGIMRDSYVESVREYHCAAQQCCNCEGDTSSVSSRQSDKPRTWIKDRQSHGFSRLTVCSWAKRLSPPCLACKNLPNNMLNSAKLIKVAAKLDLVFGFKDLECPKPSWNPPCLLHI